MSPHLISSPLLRREALASSRIEGTVATPQQLVLLEVDAAEEMPVEGSAHESVARAEALLALRDDYRQRLQAARSSALLLKLVDNLFVRPSMSIGLAGSLLEVTPASAAANLRKLVEAKVLVEVTGRRRDQRFVAPEIMRVSMGE